MQMRVKVHSTRTTANENSAIEQSNLEPGVARNPGMENDLQSSSSDQPANIMTNGHTLDPSQIVSAAINSAASSSGLLATPIAVSNTSPTKVLSNIQPKVQDGSNKRQIVPKNDVLTSAVQQLTSQPAPAANVIVPQGIQHVLINGQLYPIIQTANGTHLLIQQPVGQVQTPGKQVFTAQPIQLGTLQPLQQKPATGTQPISSALQGQLSFANMGLQPAVSVNHTSANNIPQHSAPVLPQMTSHVVPTVNDSASSIPNSFTPQMPQSGSNNPSKQNNMKTPLPVDAKTQQLLTKIQSQIDAFKSKPSLDAAAKTTLQQLQEVQQRVLNNVRSHVQNAQLAATGQKPAVPGNGAMNSTPVQQQTFVHPSSQLLQQVMQSNVREKTLIIKPVADGTSPVNAENVAAIIQSFTNVKVGNQIYNIQLMEDQKKLFVGEMSKMDAEQQQTYLTQQQTQILQTVFKNQQEMQMRAQSTAMRNQQYSQPPFSQQSTIPPPPNPLPAPSKSNGKLHSGRRSATRGRKANTLPSTPVRTPPPSITLPEPVSKTAVKKPRTASHLSTKRIGEKMLQQIMKDQEILLKPGNHKKAFANKNQVKERLLRFHLFYTAEPHKAYRRLQEEELYRTTAHETVLGKERLMDQFRSYLWRDSIKTSEAGEDVLIAQLLLRDEKDAVDDDKLLEEEDIEKFKELYRVPDKEPTPPPSPEPSIPGPTSPLHPSFVSESVDIKCQDEGKGTSPSVMTSSELQTHQSSMHKTKAHEDLMAPEVDVMTRVKRETAREARERRAAKRRVADGSDNIDEISVLSNRKGKRGRGSKSSTIQHIPETRLVSPPPDEDSSSVNQQLIDESSNDQSHSVSNIQEESAMETLEQTEFTSELLSNISSRTSPDEKSSKRSEFSSSSSSDSEDELIDIGSPLSPPTEQTSPILSLPVIRTESPSFSSPSLTSSDTNSPRKGFSIFSETVIEQSEQPYTPIHYEQHHSTIREPSYNTHQYSQKYLNATPNDNWPTEDNVQTQAEVEEFDGSNTGSRQSNLSSSVCSDEEVGGMPVTWEDNSVDVPSEVPSEVEESDQSSEDGDAEGSDINIDDDSPIMPLRINKRQLGEYAWRNNKSSSESPPATVANNPIPPPIKLRIKRDVNDKWEAASSVSSYTSEVNVSEEDTDTEAMDGGVAVNWENAGSEEDADSDQPDVEESDEAGNSQADDEDDMVPFEHYTSQRGSSRYS